MWQQTLLGHEEPSVDTVFRRARRTWLDDEAWVDFVPEWVSGSTRLFEQIWCITDWHQKRREMYERIVDVPRLTARYPRDGVLPPVVGVMTRALSKQYGYRLERVSSALYRDGSDSVAWHRDRGVRELDDGIVAIVSLGGPRTFMTRPLGGGESTSFRFGWGDLLVMGGTGNRDWEHCVPKTSHADPRIALMFRHTTE